jgi:pilus assembly protein Flp/PilA
MWRTAKSVIRLVRDSRAATAVEYGLIAALIVIAIIASLNNFAGALTNMWNLVDTKVTVSSSAA